MNTCFFFHRWTKWEIKKHNMIDRETKLHYIEERQRRTCTVCNYVEERDI